MGLKMRLFLIVVITLVFLDLLKPFAEWLVSRICMGLLYLTGGVWDPFWLEEHEQLSYIITFVLSVGCLLLMSKQKRQ